MEDYSQDRLVINRVLAGDVQAFEVIVERYQRVVFGIAFRLLGNIHEAEDASQEAFLKCYEHLRSYDRQRPFAPWLYRIVTNLVFTKLRRQKKRVLIPLDKYLNNSTIKNSNINDKENVKESPEAVLERSEVREGVITAIKGLNSLDQAIIILRYFEDLPYEEIAYILNMRRNTVEVRLHRARQKLRVLLEPFILEGRTGNTDEEVREWLPVKR